jgi:HEAT repeat protein
MGTILKAIILIVACQTRAGASDEPVARRGTSLLDKEIRSRAAVLADSGPDAVDELATMLRGKDAVIRRLALDVVPAIGPHAAPLVPLLAEMLKDPDLDKRIEVFECLAALGRTATAAMPAVATFLDADEHFDVYWATLTLAEIQTGVAEHLAQMLKAKPRHPHHILDALRQLGPQAAPAIDALGEWLSKASSDENTERACSVISAIGPPAKGIQKEMLTRLTATKDARLRRSILTAIVATTIPEEPVASSELRLDLQSDDAQSRVLAAQALLRAKPNDQEAIQTLVDAFRSADRESVVQSFEYASPGAIPYLVAALEAPEARVRVDAVRTLWSWWGSEHELVVPPLLASLSDTDRDVRESAAYGIWFTRPPAALCVAQLTAALQRERDDLVRVTLIGALERQEEDAATALPALLPFCTAGDARTRAAAVGAAARIGADTDAAWTVLSRAFEDPEARVRRAAASGVSGWKGEHAKDAADLLVKLLADKDRDVKWNGVVALGEIGANSASAAGALEDFDSGQDDRLRLVAAVALARVRADGKSGVETLTRELSQAGCQFYNAGRFGRVCDHLGSLGPIAESAEPSLKRFLGSRWTTRVPAALALFRINRDPRYVRDLTEGIPVSDVSFTAIQAVTELGPIAREAIPALLVETRSADAGIRESATHALGIVGRDREEVKQRLRELCYDPNRYVRSKSRRALAARTAAD